MKLPREFFACGSLGPSHLLQLLLIAPSDSNVIKTNVAFCS